VTELGQGELLEITLRTLSVCGAALLIALGLGLPIGIALGRQRFPSPS
jgi:ABC-type nitrate/sulfonate/bicarbonate transport system permease component